MHDLQDTRHVSQRKEWRHYFLQAWELSRHLPGRTLVSCGLLQLLHDWSEITAAGDQQYRHNSVAIHSVQDEEYL